MAEYLVTGGCGFIGSHLADALAAAGHRVRILDDLSTGKRENAPEGAEIVVGDVADPAAVRRCAEGADGVFHLAAIASVERSNEDWLGTHRVNLTGTINIFEATRRRRVPVVYASSAAVFGDNEDVPLDESSATRPLTAYGADKLGCELHGRVATLVHGVPTTGLRFFNVYGPRQDPSSPYSGVISIFADRARAGAPITIHGDGTQTRDFIYVADVVRALIRAMAAAPATPEVYNVCTGTETSVAALAALVNRLSGGRSEIRHGPARTGDVKRSLGNPAKALASLGFSAETALEHGLDRTLGSIREGASPPRRSAKS